MIAETNERQTAVTAEQSNEQAKATAKYIAERIEAEEERRLHNALTARFGATVGLYLEHLVFWSGRSSHCENGWFYRNRDEIQYATGLDRRDQDFARKVLRGDREWKRRTLTLLHEHRPSRRKATHFRVDLIALADLLDVELPDELLPEEDLDDFDIFGEEDITESPCRAAESPYRATESPNRASESLNRAASASTTASSSSSSFSSSLHSSGADAKNGAAPPQINKAKEPQEQEQWPGEIEINNKRHSQDSDDPLESTSATEELSPAEKKDRRFIRAALEDPPNDKLVEALRRYRTGQIDLRALADTMRHENYLRGANAYSSLRPEQVGAVLEEMRETVAA